MTLRYCAVLALLAMVITYGIANHRLLQQLAPELEHLADA